MSGIPTATILSDGEVIPGTFCVLSIETTKVANKLPYAQVVLIDGNAADQNFAISSSPWFEPGKAIEIKLRYERETSDSCVFKGVVVSQNIQAGSTGSQLIVEIKDACFRLDAERCSAVYSEQSIRQVIETILQRNQLQPGDIDSNDDICEQLVQYQSSDWDFLLMRADVNELIVMIDDGVLSARKADLSAPADHKFDYGISPCLGFDMNASISQQYMDITASDWDIQSQSVSTPAVATQLNLSQGSKLPLGQIAKVTERETDHLVSMISGSELEMQAWANSAMQKNRLSLFRGTITLVGDASIKLGDLIDISGVGSLFSGKTLVTGVSHTVNQDGWQTIVQFGLSPQWYAEQYSHISALPAAGLVPNVSGLQIGIVEYFEPDPEREFHLQVRVPSINTESNIVWARLSTLYAGKDKGLFFIPDPGDEVIVGFINDDPRDAIILGAAYSEINSPPQGYDFTEENSQQGIITFGDLQLSFSDKSQEIRLTTPEIDGNKNEIRLQGEKGIEVLDQFENTLLLNEQGITLKDRHGNSIAMTADGIRFNSISAINLTADGATNITAADNMKLKASMIDLN